MSPRSTVIVCCLLLLPHCSSAQGPARPAGQTDVAREKVYPALVNITVVMRYYNGGRAQRSPGGGSGVIVTPQGHVLTNYHVAGNTTRILCTLPDGEELIADVVVHDPLTDLSVLKLRTDGRLKDARPLPYASLGDSEALHVGDPVVAMGNPLMLSSSLTVGVVSNPRRVFTDFQGSQMEEMELEEDVKTGLFTRWIQHDAMILPGNSGGPLVNLAGQVVGINELGGNGVGFAIPSNTAARVLKQALEKGKVERGWLGLTVLPVHKLGRDSGALVSSVTPGSAAQKAGIAPGDILTDVGGKPVAVRYFEQVPDLYQQIADLPIGRPVQIDYFRSGMAGSCAATVEAMTPLDGDEEEIRKVGVTVKAITSQMVAERRLATREGVLVTGVRPGYPAEGASPQLAEGDVITSVASKPTPGLEAFREAVGALDAHGALIAFRRKSESLVTVVKPKQDGSQEEGGELPKAWIGIKTQVVTPELAASLQLGNVKGFRVTEVYPETEAATAKLQTGDIVTTLNGVKLEASRPQDAEDLKRAIEDLSVGDKAELTLLRSGAPLTVSVVMEAAPSSAAQAKKSKQDDFEFSVREITRMDRIEQRWKPEMKGLLVTDVVSGGWAQMAGLHADDVILAVMNEPVAGIPGFEAAMASVLKGRPKVISIFVRRDESTTFVFIEPDWGRIGR